ncbi:MAG: hypothetical protein ACQEUZ_01655 [Pseudomonadota bacterium]
MKSQSNRGLAALRLALLGAASTAFALNLAASPAGNPEMRESGPYGDWRLAPGASFYDAGNYLFEMGFAHIAAAASAHMARRAGEPSISPEGQAGIPEARALIRESVERSPADARSWAALALAASLERDGDTLEAALRRSWKLAPNNAFISGIRLMAIVPVQPSALDEEATEAVLRDLRMARARQSENVERLIEIAPVLQALEGRDAAQP